VIAAPRDHGRTYPQLREQAAQAALRRIAHLLTPQSVHLLTARDITDALTAGNDILAPEQSEAAARLSVALREIDRLSAKARTISHARDEAKAFADALAEAAGVLVGRHLAATLAGPQLWRTGLAVIDEIAAANHRPLPSQVARPGLT
jgi:hypothetical protein